MKKSFWNNVKHSLLYIEYMGKLVESMKIRRREDVLKTPKIHRVVLWYIAYEKKCVFNPINKALKKVNLD